MPPSIGTPSQEQEEQEYKDDFNEEDADTETNAAPSENKKPAESGESPSTTTRTSGQLPNNLANFDDTRPLNSPRSLEACRRLGISPAGIAKKRMEDYREIGMSKENLKLKFEFMEEKRKDKVKTLRDVYEQILREEQITSQSRISRVNAQQQELEQKRKALNEHLEREREALRKLQERQKEELAKAILHEMESAKMASEIEDRIQQKDLERKQRLAEQREVMSARFAEQRKQVQQRIEAAMEAQRRLEEEQVQIWAKKQEQMKANRQRFEEMRVQQLEVNHKKAASKHETIKMAQQRLRRIEDDKIKIAIDKQHRAEIRVQEQQRIRLEREQLKKEQEAEKEKSREVKIQKMRDEDQRRIQVLEERNRIADETLAKIMEEKRVEIERKAQMAKLKASEKIDFLQRLNRIDDMKQEEALVRINEYNQRIEKLQAEKDKILDERRKLHLEEAVQRQRFREYIANMKRTKQFKPPSWMNLDLSEYESFVRSNSSQERPSSSLRGSYPNSDRSHRSESHVSRHSRVEPLNSNENSQRSSSAKSVTNKCGENDESSQAAESAGPTESNNSHASAGKPKRHSRRQLKIDPRFRGNPLARPLQHLNRPGITHPPSPPRLVFTSQQ